MNTVLDDNKKVKYLILIIKPNLIRGQVPNSYKSSGFSLPSNRDPIFKVARNSKYPLPLLLKCLQSYVPIDL